jgi:hypothetical protein
MNEEVKNLKQSNTKNERGLFLVFFPLIFINILTSFLDTYLDLTEFKECDEYFKQLYRSRALIFLVLVIFWKKLKEYVSGYLVIFIYYFFNIMIVFSDIQNINNFKLNYIEHSNTNYYRTFYLKILVNYFFLITWLILFLKNISSWYNAYKQQNGYSNSEEEIINENENKKEN